MDSQQPPAEGGGASTAFCTTSAKLLSRRRRCKPAPNAAIQAATSPTTRPETRIIALVAAGLSAITTNLNAAQRTEQAQASGNLFLALQSDARIARDTDLPRQSFDEARATLAELRVRQDETSQSSALPARYAYWRARKNIERGGQRYEIDHDERGRG